MDRSQREYFLRQQLKAIQQELGEGEELAEEIAGYRRLAEEQEDLRGGARGARAADPPARAQPSRERRDADHPHLSRLADRAALGDALRGRPRPRPRAAGPRRGPLRPREDQGAHPRVPGGAQAQDRTRAARSSASSARPASARPRSADRSPARWAASSCASRSAACATRPRSAATAAPTSARCPAASSRASARPARATRCSCSTRSTRSAPTSAAIRRRRCSRCSTRSRTTASSTTTSACPTTCRR